MGKPVRHLLGLSGGKDSAALAIYMRDRVPGMEYFFCDTHKELPETYEYLDRLEAKLGAKIVRLSAERGFDHWLTVKGGFLPSPRIRWCTELLKIKPLEAYVGDDEVISYVGIRADENRAGYISTRPNIRAVFPFKEAGLVKADIFRILEDSGVGIPSYYKWRTRSGCFFCFFQRKYEWIRLADEHPDLFAEAVRYEETHADGRHFSWIPGETLMQLLSRRDEVLAEHERKQQRELGRIPANQPLADVLARVLDAEDDEVGCAVCHI